MNRLGGAFLPCVMLALAAALFPGGAAAHPAQFTTLQVTVEPSGAFEATLNIDLLAYALGKTSLDATNEEMEALLAGPRSVLAAKLADAGERFRREVVVRTNAGDAAVTAWALPGMPEVNAVLARNIHPRILMPGDISFSGTLPAGARSLSVRLPYVLGDTFHVYTLPQGGETAEQVAAGAYSAKAPLPAGVSPPGNTGGRGGRARRRVTKEWIWMGGGILLLAVWLISLFRRARFKNR